jgi:hypothetical protein
MVVLRRERKDQHMSRELIHRARNASLVEDSPVNARLALISRATRFKTPLRSCIRKPRAAHLVVVSYALGYFESLLARCLWKVRSVSLGSEVCMTGREMWFAGNSVSLLTCVVSSRRRASGHVSTDKKSGEECCGSDPFRAEWERRKMLRIQQSA